MMLVLLLTISVIAIVMGAMAIGVIMSGRKLKGSCGGIGESCACDRAGIPRERRACMAPPASTTPVS
jgi:hypothetical protein